MKMKAPTKMYRLKPVVVHDFAVAVPKCMYKLKNIHRSEKVDGSEDHVGHVPLPAKKLEILDQVKQFLQNCQEIPGMAELVAKQNDILEQLAQLKKQIYALKGELKLQNDSNSKEIPSAILCSRPISHKNSLPDTLVVSFNPSSPPYSLELLQRLLQNQIGLVVTSYLHSSVSALPDAASRLKESLENFKPPGGVPVVNIRLIWKNTCANSEFLLSQTLVSGEVNMLRFLSRSTNTLISYDSDANSLEIDSLLDQCYLLTRAKTKVERTNIVQILNKSLNKSQWLLGRSQVGIVDVAAYSAIRQCLSPSELNVNLAKWYGRCDSLVSS